MPFADKPAACQGCPAREIGVGFVSYAGPVDAKVVFVGQGPGEVEASSIPPQPFHRGAPAGSTLTRWIYRAELQRTEVLITNLVSCWLTEVKPEARDKIPINKWGSRDPTKAEAAACWQRHLGPLLQKGDQPGRYIIPVGAPAARWFLGIPWSKGAERYAGTMQEVDLPEVPEEPTP